MKDITIGNLLITKKGVLILTFLFFIIGVLLGGTIMASNLGKTNLFIFIPFLIIIWLAYIPTLKKEIKSIKTNNINEND